MNSSTDKAIINIQQYADSEFERGKRQWELLDSIIRKYRSLDISEITDNDFLEPVWNFKGCTSGDKIYFDKNLSSSEHLPFQIFLKVLAIVLIKYHGLSASAVRGALQAGISRIVPYLISGETSVLSARKGTKFLTLVALEPSDIELMCNEIALENGSFGSSYCYFLDWIERFQSHEDLMVFASGIMTPWKAESQSVNGWLKKFKERHNLLSDVKPYPALSDETVSKVINKAIKFVEGIDVLPEQGIDITSFENTNPILELMHHVKSFNDSSDYTPSGNPYVLSRSREFRSLISSHKDHFEEMNPFSPHLNRNLMSKQREKDREIFNGGWFINLFDTAKQAAVWLIALTTGLRNYDLRNLKTNCLHYSKKFKIWYIKADIKKTKNTIYIPVGEPTVRALKLLNWLRFNYKSDYLIQHRTFTFTKQAETDERYNHKTADGMNKLLQDFTKNYGFSIETISDDGDEGTCHCIRATLAGFIGRHSTLAILILKKLFGHSNNLMPDRYLHHNVFVKKQRTKQLQDMHSQTAHSIAKSIVSGEVAGKKGEELKNGAEHLKAIVREELGSELKSKNQSLNEADVNKKLVDVLAKIILDDIENQQSHTLLTPMGVICMRATNHSSDSPCAAINNKNERDTLGVSRTMFGAVAQLPNPAQCTGADCADALLTKTVSLPLLEQFDWYTNVYRHHTFKDKDLAEDATHFVNTYYPIMLDDDSLRSSLSFRRTYGPLLKTLYGNVRKEGYFDE